MIKYPLNVTIDSNIFDAAKYDLSDDSTLSLLISYVKQQKIKVILSNIVVGEIRKHIKDRAYEIATMVNHLRQDLKKNYSSSLIKDVGMGSALTRVNREELAQKAQKSLTDFIGKLNPEIMNSQSVDADKIFDDYFAFEPPFENNDKKRKEFPDAFIVAQIKKRFPAGEKVAIVSADNGFKAACGNSPDYLFFDSLGMLFDKLNKEEQNYVKSKRTIHKLSDPICNTIKGTILNNDCVNVIGISYDKDGIPDGFDYDETIVDRVSNVSIRIHTIDEITEDHITATLICSADIEMICYYEDYDNAAWDSESNSFFYVKTRTIKEIHHPNFGVRIKANEKTNDFEISPFTVRLGGDSRKERYDITDNTQDAIDWERENMGFVPLNEYNEYLEDALANSQMQQDVIDKFQIINYFLSDFEDVNALYDEIMEQIKEAPDTIKNHLSQMIASHEECGAIPLDPELLKIVNMDINDLYEWIKEKNLELQKITDHPKLPDIIEFGDSISFPDAYGNTYTLAIDELQICPMEGQTETINICLTNNSDPQEYTGSIELTVGYLDFDEDGGVADGLEDNINFNYNEITKGIDNVIDSLTQLQDVHNMFREIWDDF